ncbi:polysaccharide deacetylase family protein [Bacteroidota bacterium]
MRNAIIVSVMFVILLLLYACFHPASQIFGKAENKAYTDKNIVALTFDDGPGNETEEILEVLKQYNVTATFFIIGERAEWHPETVKKISALGHEIGTHGYSHKFFFENNYEDISKSKEVLENITNKTIEYFRPPYGFRTPKTYKTAKELDLKIVTWNIFPMDFFELKEETIFRRTVRQLESGSIITLHDGPENKEQTVNVLPKIIEEARNQGFEFVTITKLLS